MFPFAGVIEAMDGGVAKLIRYEPLDVAAMRRRDGVMARP